MVAAAIPAVRGAEEDEEEDEARRERDREKKEVSEITSRKGRYHHRSISVSTRHQDHCSTVV